MAEQNRNNPSNQQNRGQQGSQNPDREQPRNPQRMKGQSPTESESWREEGSESNQGTRSDRESSDVAHDTGPDVERRGFDENRQSGRLDSDLEQETSIESEDEENTGGTERNR